MKLKAAFERNKSQLLLQTPKNPLFGLSCQYPAVGVIPAEVLAMRKRRHRCHAVVKKLKSSDVGWFNTGEMIWTLFWKELNSIFVRS